MNPIGLINLPNAAIMGGGARLPGRNLQREGMLAGLERRGY
jgi:hypothetical protein